MSDDSLKLRLEQLLSDCDESIRRFAAESQRYRLIAREQNRQLAIGRMKIDAAKAALDARNVGRRLKDLL